MAAPLPSDAIAPRVEPPVDRPAAISFADFRLDLPGSRLLRAGQVIPLRPKTWAVLLYLAERPGVLVSKDELLDAVWPGVAVTPETINKSIGELRAALGDDRRSPRVIETAHRRGFRFVAATSPTPEADEGMARAKSFVGRDDEMTRLTALLAQARAGARQIVFITGPAGVGKTALVEAFLDSPSVREPATPVWVGQASCIEHHGQREPYLPVLETLERLSRRPGAGRLLELLRRVAPMWLVQMPWLIDEAEGAALRQSLQGVRAERMLRELAVLLEALTLDLTLVLVIEDLHWSDPATVDLLSLLAQRGDSARLLLIGHLPAEPDRGQRARAGRRRADPAITQALR